MSGNIFDISLQQHLASSTSLKPCSLPTDFFKIIVDRNPPPGTSTLECECDLFLNINKGIVSVRSLATKKRWKWDSKYCGGNRQQKWKVDSRSCWSISELPINFLKEDSRQRLLQDHLMGKFFTIWCLLPSMRGNF